MKLAEALCVRADLHKKIDQLEERLKSVVKLQEGDEPTEVPEDLFSELHQAAAQLEIMTYRVNATNMHTVKDGESITKMIAKKDALTLLVGALRNVLRKASEPESRYSRNEIKYITTIDVKWLRNKIDSVSAELRRIDLQIQELNWMAELEEMCN